MPDDAHHDRRAFLTGRALQAEATVARDSLADELLASEPPPTAGSTVRLTTQAMACEFAVILNPGPGEQVMAASDALDLVHRLEDQMSVYRDHSELSKINRQASQGPVAVDAELFDLLDQSRRICKQTCGAFDPTSRAADCLVAGLPPERGEFLAKTKSPRPDAKPVSTPCNSIPRVEACSSIAGA